MKLCCLAQPFEYNQRVFTIDEEHASGNPVAETTLENLNEILLNYSDLNNINDIEIWGENEAFITNIAKQLKEESRVKYNNSIEKNIGVKII